MDNPSFSQPNMMHAEAAPPETGAGTIAIRARGLGKAYTRFSSPVQRLAAALWRSGPPASTFWALQGVDLEIPRGEVLGVVGQNGAGKSTLLQLLCGTLEPTTGTLEVQGRIAALLELGAGFNPEFSGRDNLLLNGPLLGLTREQLMDRLEDIIAFSGIGAFVDQPVKTYSSGMFVRLAFSLATSVDPDILVIDEALSVGDGEFARKSFDRIQAMKARGTTILFCSHALYQVAAFCDRVAWLHAGQMRDIGEPQKVVRAYEMFLAGQARVDVPAAAPAAGDAAPSAPPTATPGHARISRVRVGADGLEGSQLRLRPGESTLHVEIEFDSDPAIPAPSAGITIDLPIGIPLSCFVARSDGVVLQRDASGKGCIALDLPRIPLRRGEYRIDVYLGHEDGVHLYDSAVGVATLHVEDALPEPGLVTLPHAWHSTPGHRT